MAGGVADDLSEHATEHRARGAVLHRRRGGSALLRKSEVRSPGAPYARGMTWTRPTRGGPGARGRCDRLRRALRRRSPARRRARHSTTTPTRSPSASPSSPPRRSPCAAARRSPSCSRPPPGVLLSLFGYAVAASGLGPVFATTSAAYLTDRRGAIARRLSRFGVAVVGLHRGSRCTASPARACRSSPPSSSPSWRRSSATSCERSASATASLRPCAGSRPARPSPRIASASRATSTTGSATRSPGSRSRPAPRRRLVERDPARTAEALPRSTSWRRGR